jgi:hypothetical protein
MSTNIELLSRRARRERFGWVNWPLGTEIEIGDLGRTDGGRFDTLEATDLGDLGVQFDTDPSPYQPSVNWQYQQDSGFELFIRGKRTDTRESPEFSSLGNAELGFSVKFSKQGSFLIEVPKVRWERIRMTSALRAELKSLRRQRRIRFRDRLVAGLGRAVEGYTLLVATEAESSITFTASGEFTGIATATVGFSFKSGSSSIIHQFGGANEILFLQLMRVRRIGGVGAAMAMTSAQSEAVPEPEEYVLLPANWPDDEDPVENDV